ncbi:CDKN2A-interacting protein [Discoglossus pictus]
MASEDDVSDFLRQNPDTAAWVESIRGVCESDKLWRHRREFILRNLSDVCGDGEQPPDPETNHRGLDRLLAYSMVWANHVFTGCRYPHDVMEKALKMAENIKVTDAPIHTTRDELVSKVKKRGISSSNEGIEEPCKKPKPGDDFKATDCSNNVNAEEAQGQTNPMMERSTGRHDAFGLSHYSTAERTDVKAAHFETSNNRQLAGNSTYSLNIPEEARFESGVPNKRKNTADCQQQTSAKGSTQPDVSAVKAPRKLTLEDTKERQTFFNRLYKTVAWKLVSAGGFTPNLNHAELLNTCIESLKATLDITFVPLKELTDLPQNKTTQENIVCELRCKAVYLGMGCGKTKENAKAVAAREVMKLFLKKKVVVRICKRKYNGRDVEDLVLLDEDSRPVNLPPALKNPHDLI